DVLKQGGLPGVDLLGSTKPPGIAALYLLLFEVFGRSLAVIHIASLAFMILMGWIVVEIGGRLWGDKAFVPASLLFLMASNSFSLPSEMIALNVEIPGMVLAAAGLLLCLRAKAGLTWALGGLLLGLAILVRQSFIMFLLPMVVLIRYHAENRIQSAINMCIGILIPWIITLAVYTAHDGLGWAFDSWVRYPLVYASDVGVAGFFTALILNMWEYVQQSFIPLALAATGKLVALKSEPRSKTVFLLSLALASFLALASGSRFFGHYFVQIIPVISLFGIPAWLWLEAKQKWGVRVLYGVTAVGLLIALTHFPTWKYWDSAAPRNGIPEVSLTRSRLEYRIADYIKANTDPLDRIAVWGYCPQIYYYAERLPAVRDYMCHYITGFSAGSFNPFDSKPPRVDGYLEAEALFVNDLHETKPDFFVDLSQTLRYTYTFLHLPLSDYPSVNEFVMKHYEVATAIPPERSDVRLGGTVQQQDYAVIYRMKTNSIQSENTVQ
ncbi:glycosyltransferase family 39 protein, partial [bacterium]|nr:glycosyltransferase family 39 protein [bacterium]